eukprot:scaffold5037_cov180-Skeletonema_marinoi.AAC.5
MRARRGLCLILDAADLDGTLGVDCESPSSARACAFWQTASQASHIKTLTLPAHPQQGVAFPTP